MNPSLWDTGVVISAMEGSLSASSLADLTGLLSTISLAELAYGVALAPTPTERHTRRMKLDVVRRTFTALPFDAAAAEHYGALAQIVREAGRSPRPRRMDLQIAATALAHGLPLVTVNAADFRDLAGVLRVIDLAEL